MKVRDFNQLSNTLDEAITAGGNSVRVNNVSFTIDEPEQHWDEAREAAVEDARERAEQLAKLAGASLGSLRSISESNNSGFGGRLEFAVPQAASLDDSFSSSTALNPGEQEISLTVFLVYDVN
ncbi:MAG TPA: SIMPL domain-containing protein [Dehalococcoidia bacterium]|nr:SIMPL domain-containing protein [Dehalococcoidia bacterium]